MSERAVIRLPELLEEEEVVANVVAQGQRWLIKHPVAAQAIYRALVAEGRKFAETDEGGAWRARLEASPAIRRLRPLWEAATLNVLEADGDAVIPSQLIELVAQALSHTNIEKTTALLSELAVVRRREPE
ncbi:MAG: hypothetical protein KF764_01845 [Labilithrix sp.]|nr:hypothetical protein [Labilithrix sp.]